jgi:hypothetical protein
LTPLATVHIPLPIQIVIDDVGWWSGEDGSTRQEPFRTGIARHHVPQDYEALTSLGRQLDMRPQAALILCEWDRRNILKRLPSSTWMGEAWDNSRWTGPWQEEAAEIIRRNAPHIELTLHGVGHEFWAAAPGGEWSFTRAEWYDGEGHVRPRNEVLAHLEYFQKLLDQHALGDFPNSFVPCAFRYRFAPDENGLSVILKRMGIAFISTPFHSMRDAEQVQHGVFGIENGVMTVNRGRDLLSWRDIGVIPQGELNGPICGMHWPNILHLDPSRNQEIVSAWVSFLKAQDARIDRMLARDTKSFAAQLAHHEMTSCAVFESCARLGFADFSSLPQSLLNNQITIKIKAQQPLRFSCAEAAILSVEQTRTGREVLHKVVLSTPACIRVAEIKWSAHSPS